MSQFLWFVRQLLQVGTGARRAGRFNGLRLHRNVSPHRKLHALVGLSFGFALPTDRLTHVSSNLSPRPVDGRILERFLRAIKAGSFSDVQYVLKHNKNIATQKHEYGWSPLHVAAFNGRDNVVAALLDAGADCNVSDEYTSALDLSRRHQEHPFKIEEVRDEFFTRPTLRPGSNFWGCTPLHYAALANNFSVCRTLLKAGADPLIKNVYGRIPKDFTTDKNIIRLLEEAAKDRKREERRKNPLEKCLRNVIVGQEGPIITVASAVRRKENGWIDEEHPLVFLFLGSSGIGKTELAKQLAKYLHKDDKKAFIRLDMSEYQQRHEVAKLIGSPPGYVGYEEGGQLTKKLRAFPNAVVLFDEVDKAHPDVLTVLLQLFDEGRLTDGQGQTIECKDAIFVMTSNLASSEIANYAIKLREDASQREKEFAEGSLRDEHTENVSVSRDFKDNVIQPILKYHFGRDEFLGRINEIVYFLPFSQNELAILVENEMKFWAEKAKQKHNIDMQWDCDVLLLLAEGYNIPYGARSIKHEVERRVVAQLAFAHEQGRLANGCQVFFKAAGGVYSEQSDRPGKLKMTIKNNGEKNFQDLIEPDSKSPVLF